MKTEKEIREEIEATNRTKDNYIKAYEDKKIPKDVLVSKLIDLNTTIDTLSWVIGENDRYD